MEGSEQSGSQSPTNSGEISNLEQLPLHSTDLLTLLDESGVIRYESPSIERIYGYTQDELIGEQVADYFHPEDREKAMTAFASIVESDEDLVAAVDLRHRQADGTYKWIEAVVSSNPTPSGHYVITVTG